MSAPASMRYLELAKYGTRSQASFARYTLDCIRHCEGLIRLFEPGLEDERMDAALLRLVETVHLHHDHFEHCWVHRTDENELLRPLGIQREEICTRGQPIMLHHRLVSEQHGTSTTAWHCGMCRPQERMYAADISDGIPANTLPCAVTLTYIQAEGTLQSVHFCGFPAADLQLRIALGASLDEQAPPIQTLLKRVCVGSRDAIQSAPSSTNVPPKDGDCAESRSCWSLQSSRNCALLCVQMHNDIQRRASHL